MMFFLLLFNLATQPWSSRSEIHDFSPQTEFSILTNDNDARNFSIKQNPNPRWQYATSTGSHIEVYDSILNDNQKATLRVLSQYRLGRWSYRVAEENVKGGQQHTSNNNIPWHNELECARFFETFMGKQLARIVENFVGNTRQEYYPYQVVAHVLRRGDLPKIDVDASREEDEVSMVIYLNKKWRKNDYGELFLYDDDKEIVAGIVPCYGRIVVWQSSIPFLLKPPSVAFKAGQLFLHIRFTKNTTKIMNFASQWQENINFLEDLASKGLFTQAGQKDVTHPVESHVVNQMMSKDGKKIFVFDGLFDSNVLDDLRSKILNYGVYFYDDAYDEDSDNVQWIAGFEVDHFVQSNLWKTVQDVATYVSGGHSKWFPYDVSCNLIRNGDVTQVHHDCTEEEDEWTFLLYLNPEWSVNHYGETVYYERGDERNEIIAEVLPKYGRVAMFQGVIPHSARPPSANFSGARLSFAVKLSHNERIGRVKNTHERLRQIVSLRTIISSIRNVNSHEDHQTDENEDIASGISLLNDIEDIDSNTLDDDPVVRSLKTKLNECQTTNSEENTKLLRMLVEETRETHRKSFIDMDELLHTVL